MRKSLHLSDKTGRICPGKITSCDAADLDSTFDLESDSDCADSEVSCNEISYAHSDTDAIMNSDTL